MFAIASSTRPAREKGRLLFLLPFINLIIIQTLWSQYMLPAHGGHDIVPDAVNATNPLIYKRLRFDNDFLQVYRRFQKDLSVEETKVTLEVNQTQADDKIRPVKYTFYENNKVEATSLTQDDIIFEALDQSYLTRLFPAYMFTYDNKRDLAESSDPRLVSQWKCNRELNFLMSQLNVIQSARLNASKFGVQLNNTLSMDVLALFDVIGSEESGLILGNNLWSGYWRQCQRSLIFNKDTVNVENTLEFKSRYCIASIRSKRWNKIAASRIPELERKGHFKYPEQKYDYARFHRIQIGICIPETCDSRLINQRHDDVRRLATYKLSKPLRSYELTDLFCLPDETSKLRQLEPAGRLFLIFIATWLAMVISATVYVKRVGLDERLKLGAKPTSFLEKMGDSMSFIRNYKRLTETKSSKTKQPTHQATAEEVDQVDRVKVIAYQNKPEVNDILFINCLKVLASLSIVLGHAGMLGKHFDRYTLDYDVYYSGMLKHFVFSTVLFVDWHFVITGFITCYLMFVTKRVERNNLADWLHTIVHRYLRLAPLYLLMFWFVKSVVKYTGSGPIWDYGTNNMTIRSICQRESYIYPLTLTANFHPIHEECVMPAWYISSDFQFHLITPFLLTLLHRAPSLGWLVSLGAIGASIALRFHRYMIDPRAKHLDLMKPRYDLYMRNNWDMHATYLYPQYRIASYLIGILAAHYTYMVLSGQWQSPLFYDMTVVKLKGKEKSSKEDAQIKKRKDSLRFLVWTYSVILLILLMFITGIVSYMPYALEPYVRYITSFFYSISYPAVGFGMGPFLITMMFGQFGSLKRWMSQPIWTIVSRLGYFILLAQVELIYWYTLSADRLNELNTSELFKTFFVVSSTLYPLSVILTILFELPIAQLELNFVAPLFKSSSGPHKHSASANPVIAHTKLSE